MKNLILLTSIFGKSDQLVAFPETLQTREAVSTLNGLIVEAQKETRSTFPAGRTTGEFEKALFACLAEKMSQRGFSIVEPHKLQRTKQWNDIRSDE